MVQGFDFGYVSKVVAKTSSCTGDSGWRACRERALGSSLPPVYKYLCQRGDVSIWSLTCEYPIGHINRGVTMELRKDGAIVQCRGFANRLPYANEVTMVKRWANQHGLTWQSLER